MSEPTPTARSARTIVIALAVVAGLGCLGTVGLVGAFAYVANELTHEPGWSEDGVPERELPRLLGVRLPVKPQVYRGRATGFQDGRWEVLAKLPPGALAAFLSSNPVRTGLDAPPPQDVLDAVTALEPGAGPFTARPLLLPDALQADGGPENLFRNGWVLEGGGATWLYFEAFET